MRSLLLYVVFFVATALLPGGDYWGTLVVHPDSPYARKNVHVRVHPNKAHDKATITLYDIKFSRFMPVKLDIIIPDVKMSQRGNTYILSGSDIVPLKGGEPYPSRKVSEIEGTLTQGTLNMSLTIGSAPIRYSGAAKK